MRDFIDFIKETWTNWVKPDFRMWVKIPLMILFIPFCVLLLAGTIILFASVLLAFPFVKLQEWAWDKLNKDNRISNFFNRLIKKT